MIENRYNRIVVFSFVLLSSVLTADSHLSGLDISADKASTSLTNSMSRLEGNVELKHQGIHIKAEYAEVQSASEKHPQIFVLSGEPVEFSQTEPNLVIKASAGHLLYSPDEEKIELENSVKVKQTIETSQFEIISQKVDFKLKKGQAEQLHATGNPVELRQTIGDKSLVITAKGIQWRADSQLAIMDEATIDDGQTTFTAAQITYSTQTGEISASGDGKTRPSYRFTPQSQEDKKKTNDSES